VGTHSGRDLREDITGAVTDAMLKKFSQKERQVERQVEDVFWNVARHRRIDLLEVCAPWDSPLAQAVQDLGGKSERIGIHNSFDLATRTGLNRALTLLREKRPRFLWLSPPCSPFSG
jgi:hypothetical protein